MNISSIDGKRPELAINSSGKESEEKVQKGNNIAVMQADTVDISDEGKARSDALQHAKKEDSQDTTGEKNGDAGKSAINVENDKKSVAELEKKLQTKKSETQRKQKKLEELRNKAEDDPTQAGELQKVKGEVDRLQKEEKKIKAEVYSAS